MTRGNKSLSRSPLNFFKGLLGADRASTARRRSPPRHRLRLEPLEERRLLAVTPVGGEFRVNTFLEDEQVTMQFNPQSVAVDDSGDFVVTWSSNFQDGDGWGVYAQRYNAAGVKQGGEFQVSQVTVGDQRNSAIAMDAVGNFVITWSAPDADGFGIYARRYTASGVALGNEFRVSTTQANNQRDSAVAMNASGTFVVTWTSDFQDSGANSGIYAQRYSSAGLALGGEFSVNTTLANDQDSSTVSMASNGNFVVTWVSTNQDGSGEGVYAQRFNSAGVKQGPEFTPAEVLTADQTNPVVSLDDAGNFVITWTSNLQDGSGLGVYAQRYNTGGVAQGVNFQVNQTTGSDQGFSRVSLDADGDFVISWSSPDGSGFGIWARQYSRLGVALTNQFLVNTTTTFDQRNSHVSLDFDGDFVVIWTSDFQDPGVSHGVYGQRYIVPNTAPTTSGITNVVVNEDSAPTAINLFAAFADAEDPDAALTYTVTANTNTSLFTSVVIAGTSPTLLTLTYAPNAFGVATITVRATDTRGEFVETNFTVTVNSVNDAPTITTIPDISVGEDSGTQSVNLSGITSGASNETQTLTVTATSSNTALIPNPTISYTSDNASGTLFYTPAANASGTVTITVTVMDNGGTANGGINVFTETFDITITALNDAPTINSIGSVSVGEDSGAQVVSFSGVGTGAANESQTITVIATSSNPAIVPHPTVIYTSPNTTGSLNFSPVANANGTVTITVTVTDSGGTSGGGVDTTSVTFTVTVTPVNDGPPTANNISASTNEDTDVTITLTGSVGVDLNETLRASIALLPSLGTLFQTADGVTRGGIIAGAGTLVTDPLLRVIYAPPLNANGVSFTTFQYRTNDGALDSAPATVTLTVLPVNDAPTLNAIANPAAIPEDSGLQTIGFSGVGSGAANETQSLTVTATSSDTSAIPNPTVTYTSPNATGTLSYTPAPNANGAITITVTVTDDGGTANGGMNVFSQTFVVNITPVDDGPPTTGSFTTTTNEDVPASIVLPGSVGVDTNETLTATILSIPAQGTLFQTPDGIALGAPITTPGTVVTNASRRVIFVPVANANGAAYATFDFKVNDGTSDSATATVTVNVTAVNDPPVAVDDQYVLGSSTGPQTAASSVLANDSDVELSALTIERVSGPFRGTLSFNPDGTFIYTPDGVFPGVDTLTYRVSDGALLSNTVTITIVSHDGQLVNKVYQQVLGRPAEPAGLQFWSAQVAAGAGLGTVASGIFESAERLDPIIAQMYTDYLLRSADPAGIAFWRGVWQRDGGPDNVVAGIVGSPEFFLSAGGTNGAWVAEVYRRLLLREPDPAGLAFWTAQLDNLLLTPEQVVLGFVRSTESFHALVRGWYLQYLGRAPSVADENFFVTQMENGASGRDVQIALIDSAEYRSTPAGPPPGVATRI